MRRDSKAQSDQLEYRQLALVPARLSFHGGISEGESDPLSRRGAAGGFRRQHRRSTPGDQRVGGEGNPKQNSGPAPASIPVSSHHARPLQRDLLQGQVGNAVRSEGDRAGALFRFRRAGCPSADDVPKIEASQSRRGRFQTLRAALHWGGPVPGHPSAESGGWTQGTGATAQRGSASEMAGGPGWSAGERGSGLPASVQAELPVGAGEGVGRDGH